MNNVPIAIQESSAFSVFSPAGASALLAMVLWICAYVFIIRIGFKERTFGVPWPSICLNITWETYLTVVCPCSQAAWLCPGVEGFGGLLLWAWLLLDVVIFSQLLIFGRQQILPVEFRRYFGWTVVACLGMAYVGQSSYIVSYQDHNGTVIAWIINLVMSALFLVTLFGRPDLRGLSYVAAWAKMLGSALTAISLHLSPAPWNYFLYFAAISVFVMDCLYIFLLGRRIKEIGKSRLC